MQKNLRKTNETVPKVYEAINREAKGTIERLHHSWDPPPSSPLFLIAPQSW